MNRTINDHDNIDPCEHCHSKYPVWFKVSDTLWEQYRGNYNLLCIDCFEKRMKRKIKLSELISTPLNLDLFRFRYPNKLRTERWKGVFYDEEDRQKYLRELNI